MAAAGARQLGTSQWRLIACSDAVTALRAAGPKTARSASTPTTGHGTRTSIVAVSRVPQSVASSVYVSSICVGPTRISDRSVRSGTTSCGRSWSVRKGPFEYRQRTCWPGCG